MTTRTIIENNILLSEEDKIRNIKYMMIQLHFNCSVQFYLKNDIKTCKFKIQKSDEWKIEYDLPFIYCFEYKKRYNNGGEEHDFYKAIFSDLKLILLSNEKEDWFIDLFENLSDNDKEIILHIKNNFFKPTLEYIFDEIGDENLKNLMLSLSVI